MVSLVVNKFSHRLLGIRPSSVPVAGLASLLRQAAQPFNIQLFLPQLAFQTFHLKFVKLRGSPILAIGKDGAEDKAAGGYDGRNER